MYPTQGSGGGGPTTTDDLPQGVTNLYYDDALVVEHSLEDFNSGINPSGAWVSTGDGGVEVLQWINLFTFPGGISGTGINNTFAGIVATGSATRNTFSGLTVLGTGTLIADGSALTGLAAANLSGTIADARLSSNIPLKNGANTFTAVQTVNVASDVVQLVVKGHSTQTNHFQDWKNSSNTVLGFIRSDGGFENSNGSYVTGSVNVNNSLLIGTGVFAGSAWPRIDMLSGFGRLNLAIGVTESSTSGNFYFFKVSGTYNQASGSAQNSDLLIDTTRTAVGSGAQYFIECKASSVQKWAVDSAGGMIVGSGTKLKKVLSATATLDFGSIAAGAVGELTITVTGALANDSVHIGPPTTLDAGLIVSGFVSAADTVKVRVFNGTAGAIDPASSTWRASVHQF